MKKNIILSVVCGMVAMASLTSCNDFLQVSATNQKEMDKSFTTYDELRLATAYLYMKPWFGFHSTRLFAMGDARGNNIYGDNNNETGYAPYCLFTDKPNTPGLADAWNSLYIVVTQADYIINDYAPQGRQHFSEAQANACEGEARFMRAAAYYYLASYWHDVPIMENPIAHTEAFNMAPTRFEDVIRYGIRDLEYAAEWLPLADADGRVTRYSALGLLARYYVTLAAYARGGHCTQATMDYYEASGSHDLADILYDLAKEAAGEVILAQNRYGLMEEYEEIFRVQNNNCKEVLFALQPLQGVDSYGMGNSNGSGLCSYTELLNGLSAYNSSYVSYDCLRMLINSGGRSRLRGNVLCPGEFYDYIGTHLVDGGWAAGYKGGQKAAGLETNRKVAFKKHWPISRWPDGSRPPRCRCSPPTPSPRPAAPAGGRRPRSRCSSRGFRWASSNRPRPATNSPATPPSSSPSRRWPSSCSSRATCCNLTSVCNDTSADHPLRRDARLSGDHRAFPQFRLADRPSGVAAVRRRGRLNCTFTSEYPVTEAKICSSAILTATNSGIFSCL